MVTLRLSRESSKKRPYTTWWLDVRARRDGKFIEKLGHFIPQRDVLVLNHERMDYWLSQGAQQTVTAKSLIKKSRRAQAAEATA